MEIRELIIYSNRIKEQEAFYKNVLGFQCSEIINNRFVINAGETKLVLEKSTKEFFYHFAFLIPTGSINAAIDYLEKKSVQLLPLHGDKIIHFDTGQAIYFYDEDGNIVEFIERPTLDYPTRSDFSVNSILKLNEIGLPVSEPKKMIKKLINEFGIQPIKNAPYNDRICWGGDFNGAIIVIKENRNWLPTEKPGMINDLSIKYIAAGQEYNLIIVNNKIKKGY
ncbi:MAG: VOC family protein [Flavobacteriaceae bacterium]|nr:VOC family protein [Flavobacteriaceae bacterium]